MPKTHVCCIRGTHTKGTIWNQMICGFDTPGVNWLTSLGFSVVLLCFGYIVICTTSHRTGVKNCRLAHPGAIQLLSNTLTFKCTKDDHLCKEKYQTCKIIAWFASHLLNRPTHLQEKIWHVKFIIRNQNHIVGICSIPDTLGKINIVWYYVNTPQLYC